MVTFTLTSEVKDHIVPRALQESGHSDFRCEAILILYGNDGTGKTSLVKRINAQNGPILAVERSMTCDSGSQRDAFLRSVWDRLRVAMLDNMTLESTWNLDGSPNNNNDDDNDDAREPLDYLHITHEEVRTFGWGLDFGRVIPVYHVILRCEIPRLKERLSKRANRDLWETSKSLFYFDQRFTELASRFGLPLLDTTHLSLDQEEEILCDLLTNNMHWYFQCRNLRLDQLGCKDLRERDAEIFIGQNIHKFLLKLAKDTEFAKAQDAEDLIDKIVQEAQGTLFQDYDIAYVQDPVEFTRRIFARWYLRNYLSEDPREERILDILKRFEDDKVISKIYPSHWDENPPLLLSAEGESKRVYRVISDNPFLLDTCFIQLKSTIYSHSKQSTGEIPGLAGVRAKGTRIFQEMFARNGIKHSYRGLNLDGVLHSKWISSIPPTEIVVKEWCLGTDKHSYHEMIQNEDVVLGETAGPDALRYRSGPVMRVDWRNPNHIGTGLCRRTKRTSTSSASTSSTSTSTSSASTNSIESTESSTESLDSLEQLLGELESLETQESLRAETEQEESTWLTSSLPKGRNPTENPYYYLFEEDMGKERFFKKYLDPAENLVHPFGDRVTNPIVLSDMVQDLTMARTSVMKTFLTIQGYFNDLGLIIQDTCFMLDVDGETIWSEVNQDCMRIKTVAEGDVEYDKDIWRAGGSSAREKVLEKWETFNRLFTEYFDQNRFRQDCAEMQNWEERKYHEPINRLLRDERLQIPEDYLSLYRQLLMNSDASWTSSYTSSYASAPISEGDRRRKAILTMDLWNGEPVLVRSGEIRERHSSGSVEEAWNKIGIFPDILMVDLNGAIQGKGEDGNNRQWQKRYALSDYVHVGGGIRDLRTVQELLSSSVRRIVVGSNTSQEFLERIPKDRLIVELSVTEWDSVLTHGRLKEGVLNIVPEMYRLVELGVEAISITLHRSEGGLRGLDRDQVRRLVIQAPNALRKIIIAGGISDMEDLRFLWRLDPRIVPQLGSAVWKDRITLSDLYWEMLEPSRGQVRIIVQARNGELQETRRICERELRWVLTKKVYGGYRVHKACFSNDMETLILIIDGELPRGLGGRTPIKANLLTLKNHLLSRLGSGGYTDRMQKSPQLALAKVMEEFWEILTAEESHRPDEVADLLIHLLMYLNGSGCDLEKVLNILNSRKWNPRVIQLERSSRSQGRSSKELMKGGQELMKKGQELMEGGQELIGGQELREEGQVGQKIVISLSQSKYAELTDTFLESVLGVRIKRPGGRGLRLTYTVSDRQKYQKYFGDKTLVLVGNRPKDMVWQMSSGRSDGCITYNTVIGNFPRIYRKITSIPDPELRLALLCRKEELGEIQVENYSPMRKLRVAAEHPCQVAYHLRRIGFSEDSFSLDRIIGSAESYLVNETKTRYDLVDSIVQSGRTLEANDLSVWSVILDGGHVTIGLYLRADQVTD